MVSIYIGRRNIYIVKGKFANEIKLDACVKVPYDEKKQDAATVLYDALKKNRIAANDCAVVLKNDEAILKYIALDSKTEVADEAVMSNLQQVFITRKDYAVSYYDAGEITVDGARKKNYLAVAAAGNRVSDLIQLAHLLALSMKGAETGVTALGKLVKFLPQVEEGKHTILLAEEDECHSVTLYRGKQMLLSRYAPAGSSPDVLLAIVSHMTQYLSRIDKTAKIDRLLYALTGAKSRETVAVVAGNMNLKAERLTPGNAVKCRQSNFSFETFAFLLGALDYKDGINLIRDLDISPSRKKIKLEMELTMEESQIYQFTQKISAAVYILGGDVESLKVNKT